MSNALQIRPASAEAMLALVAVTGPAGGGKTLGALLLAHGLGGKIAVLDTEVRTDRRGVLRGRSETYRGLCDATTGNTPLHFDVLPLEPPYTVERYLEALELCWKSGYDVVVVDSLSHEWFGVLDQADKMKSAGVRNQYTDVWGKLSPAHERFIERLMRAPSHLICTMRTKMAYEVVDGKPRKIGLQPIQRDGVDYQFEVIFDVGTDHTVSLQKANANYGKALGEEVSRNLRITSALGEKLKVWLDGPQVAANESLKATVAALGTTPDKLPEALQPDADLLAVNFAEAKDQRLETTGSQPEPTPVAESHASAAVPVGITPDDELRMGEVVPVGLAKRVCAMPTNGPLDKADANDFNVYLIDFLGKGSDGKKKATEAWGKVGVVVRKGAVVTRDQAVAVARLVTNKE